MIEGRNSDPVSALDGSFLRYRAEAQGHYMAKSFAEYRAEAQAINKEAIDRGEAPPIPDWSVLRLKALARKVLQARLDLGRTYDPR